MAQLGWYVNDAQQLLHDGLSLFTSRAQLVRWINNARREAARRTGCIQRVITGQSAFGASAQTGAFIPGAAQPGALPGTTNNASLNSNASQNTFQTITGVERYSYQFANPYLKQQYAGLSGITDVISVSVSWGGSVRPSLDWLPWDVLQARARAFATLVTSYPYWWSTLNDGEHGEVWLFPVPSFNMEMEWQVFAVPADLNTDDDFDAIPPGFSNAIKYGAAGLAFLSQQRWYQAKLMQDQFADELGISRFAADTGKSSSYYPTAFR